MTHGSRTHRQVRRRARTFSSAVTGSVAPYTEQAAWRELQLLLPKHHRITPATAPAESAWTWRNNHVHLDRYENPYAPATVILHHGVGTNGRQMTLLLGTQLAARGYDVVAVDNLGYGMTQPRSKSRHTYATWVDLMVDFVAAERTRADRPIFLFGLSAGGMLTYHVAARTPVDGIIGMTYLDQRDQTVRDRTSFNIGVSRIGVPLLSVGMRLGLGSLPIPMRLASKMSALVNNPAALKIMLADPTSAGNSVPLRFLHSYMNYAPAVEPEDFRGCPILLTQPGEDRWSPIDLSDPVINKVRHVPTTTVVLDNAGHYPIEQPGLTQLTATIIAWINDLTPTRTQH